MLSNKRGCPRRTNVGLDRVYIIALDWSMDDMNEQRLMHEHVASMQRCIKVRKAKPVAQSKQGKHINSHGAEKGVY